MDWAHPSSKQTFHGFWSLNFEFKNVRLPHPYGFPTPRHCSQISTALPLYRTSPKPFSHHATASRTIYAWMAFSRSKSKFYAIVLILDHPHISHIVVAAPVTPGAIETRSSGLGKWRKGLRVGKRSFGEHRAGDEIVSWRTTVDQGEPAVAALGLVVDAFAHLC